MKLRVVALARVMRPRNVQSMTGGGHLLEGLLRMCQLSVLLWVSVLGAQLAAEGVVRGGLALANMVW